MFYFSKYNIKFICAQNCKQNCKIVTNCWYNFFSSKFKLNEIKLKLKSIKYGIHKVQSKRNKIVLRKFLI